MVRSAAQAAQKAAQETKAEVAAVQKAAAEVRAEVTKNSESPKEMTKQEQTKYLSEKYTTGIIPSTNT